MMRMHYIRLREQFCDAVNTGRKPFEIRRNDRDYQPGDLIQFLPENEDGHLIPHPIANKVYRVTYVLSGWGLRPGFVVFGIRERSAV